MNTLKTGFLLVVMSSLLVMAGYFLGGVGGMAIALVLSIGMNFMAYWHSDKLALRMAGAKEVTPQDAPVLHSIVEEQAMLSGLPKPRVYLIENDSPNAFATGRSPQKAAVAATTGIMRILKRDELAAVMAHEMAHVGNRDTLIMTVAASVAGAITFMAMIARFSMLFGGMRRGGGGGHGAMIGLIGMLGGDTPAARRDASALGHISRPRVPGRHHGSQNCRNPLALANALEKLEAGSHRRPMKVNEAVSHLFIVNPLSGITASLFSTHPPIRDRVARLRQMRG